MDSTHGSTAHQEEPPTAGLVHILRAIAGAGLAHLVEMHPYWSGSPAQSSAAIRLHDQRKTRELIDRRPPCRKVLLQQLTNLFNAPQHTRLEIAAPEVRFHCLANCFPFATIHLGMNASVRDDLDVTIGKQDIDEDAVVVFGVPDPQFRKDINRSRASRRSLQHGNGMKCSLDREPHLPNMRVMTGMNRSLNGDKRLARERSVDAPVRHEEMPKGPFDVHGYHLPEAPPPPNPPPPPRKISCRESLPSRPLPPPINRPPAAPIPLPSSVNTSAISPAARATNIASDKIQASTPMTPPVTTAPGNRPSNARNRPPAMTVRRKRTGRSGAAPPDACCPFRGAGSGSPLTTRIMLLLPAEMPP